MPPFAHLIITVCFACYASAFMLEVFRLLQRGNNKLYAVNCRAFFAVFGFVLHTFFLYQQHIAADRHLGGAAMLFFASAWGLVLIYLLWLRRYPNIPFGIIVLPLVFVLLCGGYGSIATVETTGLSFRAFAKMLHIVSAAGFVIAVLVFIICRLLYFLEVRLLRKKCSLIPPTKLPSLEWSSTISRISLVIAGCCLGLCALGGIIYLVL